MPDHSKVQIAEGKAQNNKGPADHSKVQKAEGKAQTRFEVIVWDFTLNISILQKVAKPKQAEDKKMKNLRFDFSFIKQHDTISSD